MRPSDANTKHAGEPSPPRSPRSRGADDRLPLVVRPFLSSSPPRSSQSVGGEGGADLACSPQAFLAGRRPFEILAHAGALLSRVFRREDMPRLRFEAMGALSQDDRPRVRMATFLAEQYRGDFARKRLARDLRCSEKVAENLLAGHWPNDLIIDGLVERFQDAFIDAVLRPAIDREQARLRSEARRHLIALAEIEQRSRVAGPVDIPAVRAAWAAADERVTARRA